MADDRMALVEELITSFIASIGVLKQLFKKDGPARKTNSSLNSICLTYGAMIVEIQKALVQGKVAVLEGNTLALMDSVLETTQNTSANMRKEMEDVLSQKRQWNEEMMQDYLHQLKDLEPTMMMLINGIP